MRSVRLTITGRVQGVGYRIWAERTALSLKLRGWVRNRRDGGVELLATGNGNAVAALIEACREGPSAANVTGVKVEHGEDDGGAGFLATPTA
jgi:acylphosphatase